MFSTMTVTRSIRGGFEMGYEEDEIYSYESGDCDVIDDYHICETILWAARHEIDPPYNAYVMFA